MSSRSASGAPSPDRPTLGLDYAPAAGHAPGVGRYVRELVRALVRLPDVPPLRLVEVGRAPRPMDGAPLGLDGPDVRGAFERRRVPLPRRAVAGLARLPGVGEALVARRCSLFHRVHPGWPPVGATRTTLAVAELPPTGAARDALAADARGAAAIVTFSEYARARVEQDLGVPSGRVHVVPVGTEHWERDLEDPAPARASRDVLVLGAVREARRPLDVLRAFEALRAGGTSARLLLVGRPGDVAEAFRAALAASPARDDVRWVADPDESRMPGCVGGASVLLHVADDEATPVTPLEATRMGLPVVASPLPAFQEAFGNAARWIDSGDPAAVADALRDALDEAQDPSSREARREIAVPYTWRACAEAHARVWDPILRDA